MSNELLLSKPTGKDGLTLTNIGLCGYPMSNEPPLNKRASEGESISTVIGALDISTPLQSVTAPEITHKFSKAALVLTTLSLITGVSVDVADDIRTAQIPIATNMQSDKYAATSITIPFVATDQLSQYVKSALNSARHEIFESGIESTLGRFINRVLIQYGQIALNTICVSLSDSVLSEDVIVEVIKSLGAIEYSFSKIYRFRVILPYLNHKSPIVRDAAALAFADLGDKGAISYLRAAANRERFSAVRHSFLSVAKEIEETQA